jgi:hypothetical protein
MVAAAALAGLSPAAAAANPLDTFGFGSRGAAMGGAQAADVHDFSANYYNPAGLARAKALEIGVGYFRADHSLYINGQNNQVDPVKGHRRHRRPRRALRRAVRFRPRRAPARRPLVARPRAPAG